MSFSQITVCNIHQEIRSSVLNKMEIRNFPPESIIVIIVAICYNSGYLSLTTLRRTYLSSHDQGFDSLWF